MVIVCNIYLLHHKLSLEHPIKLTGDGNKFRRTFGIVYKIQAAAQSRGDYRFSYLKTYKHIHIFLNRHAARVTLFVFYRQDIKHLSLFCSVDFEWKISDSVCPVCVLNWICCAGLGWCFVWQMHIDGVVHIQLGVFDSDTKGERNAQRSD